MVSLLNMFNKLGERIVLITRNETGGVLTYVCNFSKFLEDHKITHKVLLYNDYPIFSNEVYSVGNFTYLKFSQFDSKNVCYKLLKEQIEDFDFLVCNDTFEIEAIDFLNLDNFRVFILHGDIPHYQNYIYNYHFIFDEIFCVSKGLKFKYQKLYPKYSFGIANPLIFDCYDEKNLTIHDSNKLSVVCVGRFEFLKGADTIITTIRYCKDLKLEINWTIIIPAIKNDVNYLSQIPEGVTIIKGLENVEVLEYFKKSDVLLFPTRSEGLPMVVLEAMKRKVVVISRNIQIGIPDLIFDRITGLLCMSDYDFGKAIELIYYNKKIRNDLKEQAYIFAHQDFGFEIKGATLLNLLGSVKKKGNRIRSKIIYQESNRIQWLKKLLKFIYYKYIKNLDNKK